MDKLVITVTCDSSVSYPGNPHGLAPRRENTQAIGDEYVRCVNAGASVVHLHGVRELEKTIQPDGRRLSRLDVEGWRLITDSIRSRVNPVIQYGIAGARLEDRVKIMELRPEMMSVAFNSHDEYFQPDPAYPPNCIYALHPYSELQEYARVTQRYGIKMEAECFHTGGYWNIRKLVSEGLLEPPIWATIFLHWQGGSWTPPTEKALIYMVDHLPPQTNWNMSVMDPVNQWKLLTLAIGMGGHVRVGYEDNPYLEPGRLAETNVLLVEKIVALARLLGREIASPDEARAIIGLGAASARR